MNQKLSNLSCVMLIINKIIGTGIFSNLSIIFNYINGNVGILIILYLVGGLFVICGLLIYLEFALNLPFNNGGELNYLKRVVKSPLIGCIYAFGLVLLGFSSGNSYTFGKYILYSFNIEDTGFNSKFIACLCISFSCLIHFFFPARGAQLFNFIGLFKIFILALIIVIGILASTSILDLPPTDNFKNIWSSTDHTQPSFYNISVALLQVIYSFKGWENVNYVLNEVANPYHVLTFSAPLAIILVTVLYFAVILAYLVVIPKQELLNSGVLCAGIFFTKIFGNSMTSFILPLIISISNLGNVLVVSYAHSLLNQELAFNNYLPYSRFFSKFKNSLLLHWLVTTLVIIAPPSTEIYEFIVNLYIYPGTWINVFISLGLIYLKLNKKKELWSEFNPISHSLEVVDTVYSRSYSSTDEEIMVGDDNAVHNGSENDAGGKNNVDVAKAGPNDIINSAPSDLNNGNFTSNHPSKYDNFTFNSLKHDNFTSPKSNRLRPIYSQELEPIKSFDSYNERDNHTHRTLRTYLDLEPSNSLLHIITPIPSNVSKKKIDAPFVCVVIFLILNLFLGLFPFVPPLNADKLTIPFWLFPVIGTGVLILGAIFYYVRPYWNKFTGEQNPILYEEAYISNQYSGF